MLASQTDSRWDLRWGVHDFTQPLIYIPLRDCASDYLEGVLRDYKHGMQALSPETKDAMESLLKWRKENNVIVSETSFDNGKKPYAFR